MGAQNCSIGEMKLVELARNGDRNAFGELFRKYQRLVLTIAHQRVPRGAAEDIVQMTFMCAFQSLEQYRQDAPIKYWLAAIARCRCIDWWRSTKSVREIPLYYSQDDQDEHLLSLDNCFAQIAYRESENRREMRNDLLLAIKKLGTADRRLIELRYIKGHSVERTAKLLQWSETNVKTRSFRVLRRLKSFLNNTWDETEDYEQSKLAA